MKYGKIKTASFSLSFGVAHLLPRPHQHQQQNRHWPQLHILLLPRPNLQPYLQAPVQVIFPARHHQAFPAWNLHMLRVDSPVRAQQTIRLQTTHQVVLQLFLLMPLLKFLQFSQANLQVEVRAYPQAKFPVCHPAKAPVFIQVECQAELPVPVHH